MTTALARVLIALSIMLATLMLIGFGWIVNQGLWENICFDRVPWWGPPQDPNSECSGSWWAEKHPGEFPWTLPR